MIPKIVSFIGIYTLFAAPSTVPPCTAQDAGGFTGIRPFSRAGEVAAMEASLFEALGPARSRLEEIYEKARLETSLRFEATALEATALINDGGGRFTLHPLPAIALLWHRSDRPTTHTFNREAGPRHLIEMHP